MAWTMIFSQQLSINFVDNVKSANMRIFQTFGNQEIATLFADQNWQDKLSYPRFPKRTLLSCKPLIGVACAPFVHQGDNPCIRGSLAHRFHGYDHHHLWLPSPSIAQGVANCVCVNGVSFTEQDLTNSTPAHLCSKMFTLWTAMQFIFIQHIISSFPMRFG